MKSSAGAEIVLLARTVVERAGAPSDAAEVEAQHGAADPAQRLRRLIHDLRVHRAAVLRMRERHGGAKHAAVGRVRAGRRRSRRELGDGSSSSASSESGRAGISRSIVLVGVRRAAPMRRRRPRAQTLALGRRHELVNEPSKLTGRVIVPR